MLLEAFEVGFPTSNNMVSPFLYHLTIPGPLDNQLVATMRASLLLLEAPGEAVDLNETHNKQKFWRKTA